MATDLRITEAEIFEALARVATGNSPEEARTVKEIAASMQMSDGVIHKALQRVKAEGRLAVHTVIRERLDGRPQKVPAYTILPAP